jgi:hypothetical protein
MRSIQKSLDTRHALGITVGSVPDRRGKQPAVNKTPTWQTDLIEDHINLYPTMESHYCRQTTHRRYLDAKLTIRKMHEQFHDFYSQHVNSLDDDDPRRQANIPKEKVYRNLFCTKFNLGFFIPKKDQCMVCCRYQSASVEGKKEMDTEYTEHMRQKDRAQEEKMHDKEKAKCDATFHSATFDMQSVLQIPCGNESLLYYKRKLVLHNLTVYEAAPPNNAYCYLWPETAGKRGANEVGSILYHYLSKLPETVTHVSFISDSCSGQNRNRFVASVLLYATQSLPIEVIDHKFLIPGHTHMECDSMHAAIEHAYKHLSLYSIHEWVNVMKSARRNRPYNVKELQYNDFYDLKELTKSVLTNTKQNGDE